MVPSLQGQCILEEQTNHYQTTYEDYEIYYDNIVVLNVSSSSANNDM